MQDMGVHHYLPCLPPPHDCLDLGGAHTSHPVLLLHPVCFQSLQNSDHFGPMLYRCMPAKSPEKELGTPRKLIFNGGKHKLEPCNTRKNTITLRACLPLTMAWILVALTPTTLTSSAALLDSTACRDKLVFNERGQVTTAAMEISNKVMAAKPILKGRHLLPCSFHVVSISFTSVSTLVGFSEMYRPSHNAKP